MMLKLNVPSINQGYYSTIEFNKLTKCCRIAGAVHLKVCVILITMMAILTLIFILLYVKVW